MRGSFRGSDQKIPEIPGNINVLMRLNIPPQQAKMQAFLMPDKRRFWPQLR
jgi:hypothetical protein